MLKSKRNILISAACFIAAEIIFGFLIQVTAGDINSALSFSSVVFALLFSAFLFDFKIKWEYFFTVKALVFTVVADYFLVVFEPRKQLLAMIFFSITQICYFFRIIGSEGESRRRLHVIVRALSIVTTLTVTFLVIRERTDALSLVSMFYFANLLCNTIFAFCDIKKSSLLPLGLLLFLFCDIIIGLSELDGVYINIPVSSIFYKITHTGTNLAWLFYVPSQTLISISLAELELKKRSL